jgi:hypothetical protein
MTWIGPEYEKTPPMFIYRVTAIPTMLKSSFSSQLCLCLSLLKDWFCLGCFHDITLDLELSRHEELLGICSASHELAEVVV